MSYLEKLKILLNQIKDTRHQLQWDSDIKKEERYKMLYDYDLEIYKLELLIINEIEKCSQDNTAEK